MEDEKKKELEQLCKKFREDLIDMLYPVQTGHPGGSLSVCEILTTLYFYKANITPENRTDRERDKIILCKGHAAPMLYLMLAEKGFFDKSHLKTLRQKDSLLQGHPCSLKTPGVEASTGPLGAGYPLALGVALADMADDLDAYTYAILGDGEINEGVVWETCMNASKFRANRLITILDSNGVQLDGTTDEIMPMGNVAEKFKAFGYHVLECDGHCVSDISNKIDEAKAVRDKPTIIIAKTVKGKGISFMEGKSMWHGKPISEEEYRAAKEELGGER